MKPNVTWISERVLFGLFIIGGYLAVGAVGAYCATSPSAVQITHDAQTTLGPLLGVIVNSIWRNQQSEKTAEALIAKTPDQPTPIPATEPVQPAPTFKG